jgi:hypothetical protein
MADAIFPRNYKGDDTPMIGFHAIKVLGNSTVAELKTAATGEWVWLPVPPEGVSTAYSQGWDSATQGIAAAAMSAGVSGLSKMFGGSDPPKPNTGVPGSAGNEGIVKASTVSGLVDLIAEKAKETAGLGVGITHRALEQSYMSYSGPGYRSHSFAFALRPETSEDSDEIDKIVKFFKFYSSPVLGDSGGVARVYDVPHLFHIELLPNAGLFGFKQAALKNVTVKYGGEKYNTFTKGNRPTQTDIGLEFQEMQLLSQKDFGDF